MWLKRAASFLSRAEIERGGPLDALVNIKTFYSKQVYFAEFFSHAQINVNSIMDAQSYL